MMGSREFWSRLSRFSSSFALILAFCFSHLDAADIGIRAYVDKATVSVGEQFTLSVELSGSDSERVPPPNPPSLDSFASYLGSGSSRSVQIVNGRMSSNVTQNYYYRATAPGSFTIPALSVSHNGQKFESQPISLQVVTGAKGATSGRANTGSGITGRDLFLRAEVNKVRVYENEPVILTYKIYTRVNVSSYSVTKNSDRTGFWVEKLLKEQQSAQTTTEIIDGVRYTVATIDKVALFPTSAGDKKIDPLGIKCEVRVRTTRRSIFDDFFSDPFGRTASYAIQSEPVEIQVLPLPLERRPRGFSGAVGQYKLSGVVDKNEVKTNDVVTFSLSVEGTGNIRTLPNPSPQFPAGLEVYEPKVNETVVPDAEGVRGKRTYEYVLVPRSSGRQVIQPIEFAYFDPVDEQYRVTGIDQITIDVERTSDETPVAGLSLDAKQNVRLLAQAIRFIKLNPGVLRSGDFVLYKDFNLWLISGLPFLAVLIATLYRRRRDRMEGDQAYARDRRARKVVRQRLFGARGLLREGSEKDFYAECGRALRGFAADKLNLSEAGIMTDELEDRLEAKGVPDSVTTDYLDCLRVSDLKHFSPATTDHNEMEDMLKRVESVISKLHRELAK